MTWFQATSSHLSLQIAVKNLFMLQNHVKDLPPLHISLNISAARPIYAVHP